MRRAIAAAALALLAVSCAAPKPRVVSADVGEPKDGKADVTVTLRNDAGAAGQVEVKVTVRAKDGSVVGRKDETVDLEDRETIRVTLEVDVGDASGELDVDAEAVYPPD